ncbi:lipase family protein [Bowmanella sp. Y26]|uniref:lipase family protein n=1 Tax=Bowmanella yangjiangensis TaxID=2811230 RepID=UPI001BDD72EA|nr:lipase family protein [Bowmanella yangjiangensis]MBT1063886.1 lipase family protein [Bowmanella yangjiangensis]
MKSKKSITLHSALKELPQGIKAGVISKYESNGFSLVDFFRASTGYFSSTDSTFGFIAEGINNGQGENRKGESLITIKGTNSWADTKTDLKTLPTNFNGHMTHRGFVQTFRSFEHHIDRYLDWHSPSKIHLVGHSLGGALATLTAYHIAKRDSTKTCQIKLYTFGAPRVGFTSFNQEVDKLIGKQNIYRVYHDADLVSMVPMLPFLHVYSSDFSDGYHLNWITGRISVMAHFMNNYISTVRGMEWGNLKGSISDLDTVKFLEGGISSGVLAGALGVAMYSAPVLTMIAFALQYILKRTHKLGIGRQLPSYATTLDAVAWLLYQGAMALKEISVWVQRLLNKILSVVGWQPFPEQSLTVAFIRWVLGLLSSFVSRMARQALEASQQQMQIALPRTLWQAPDGHPTPNGLRPRQNAYRIPGPNTRLGGTRGPLAL